MYIAWHKTFKFKSMKLEYKFLELILGPTIRGNPILEIGVFDLRLL